MATKAITPVEEVKVSVFLDSARYDQAFPSLGAEPAARVVSSSEPGSTKAPISAQANEFHKENLTPAAPDNRSKAHGPTAPIPSRRNSSYGSPKEILDQYIPEEIIRSVSLSGRDQLRFGLTQGLAKKESYSSLRSGKRRNSGYHNPTRSQMEGYSTKTDEDREGNPSRSPATRSSNPARYRGSLRRRGSYSGRGSGRPMSRDGAPLNEINWRHEHPCSKKNGSAQNDGDCINETGSPGEHSPISQLGESPIRATTGPSDITRPVFGNLTEDISPDTEGGLGGETESTTPSPKGKASIDLERGNGEEIKPSTLTPEPETASVASGEVSLFSSSSRTAGPQADDTSAPKPHDAPNNVQKLSLRSSKPPPPPTLYTPTPSARLSSLHSLISLPPPKPALLKMSDSYEERMEKSKKKKYSLLLTPLPEKVPRKKLSVNEYLGIVDEYPWPQQDGKLPPPPPAKAEDGTISDNKTAIRDTDKMDLDEGYEAIGPSKVVQYASTVQGKAFKALASHDKVNFGDIDSRKAAPAPSRPAFNPFAGLTDQRSPFDGQSSEVRLPPRPVQPPPGLSLPPGLPIPASYYQQQGIGLQTAPGNMSFPQPRESATPFGQTIDNPHAVSGQYRMAYPDAGAFTVGQRSDVNEYNTPLALFPTTLGSEVLWLTLDTSSYLGLNVTDAEIQAINETFSKFGLSNKFETTSFTDHYGRRGAVSEQGGTWKDGKPANNLGNSKTTEEDNFTKRFLEVFGREGKVSIEMLQEHQKERLVAERVRNEKLAAEDKKKVPEPVTGNTGLFPYPAHGKSDGEVTQELLLGVFKQLSSYVDDKSIIRDPASGAGEQASAYQPGPWKKPPAGKTPDWISDDNTIFFDQSFGKDFFSEGKEKTTDEGIDAVKLEQTTAEGDASTTGDSGNQSVNTSPTAQGEQLFDEAGNVIFGPPKPPGYPNHLPRTYLRPLKTFAPFETVYPTVRYGLLPAAPRSVNTAEKSYINYRGGAVGPIADSAPRYVRGPKGYLELAKDTPPAPPADPSPFGQSKATASPFAALEQALGTTRFTQGVPQNTRLVAPIPPPGAKPTGGIVSDAINGFSRVNYGGRQTQLDPDGSGLSRSEVLKRKQRPGARIGVISDGPNGMEFEIDKHPDFNPAEHNTLGGKFKLKSLLVKEQEALRAQQSQQSQQTHAGGAHPATPTKGIPVQGKGSDAGGGSRSVFDTPTSGNPRPSPGTPGKWPAQGSPESKRGMKGWNGGMGGK